MTIVIVGSWVVKPEKQAEFTKLWQRFQKYAKDDNKQFKEMKWNKTFTHVFFVQVAGFLTTCVMFFARGFVIGEKC